MSDYCHPLLKFCVWSVLIAVCGLFWSVLIMLLTGCQTLGRIPGVLPPVVTPTTVPATTTTQPPVASVDAIPSESIRTKGSRANLRPTDARVRQDMTLTVKHTARGIEFDYPPHGWQGGETVARIYAAYHVDGQWIGGQWDDVRPNQRFKERKNLTGFTNSPGHTDPPRFGVAPQDGQIMYYWLSNLANTERTPIVAAQNTWGIR